MDLLNRRELEKQANPSIAVTISVACGAIGKLKRKAEGPRRKVFLIHLEFDGLAWVGWIIMLYKILWDHRDTCWSSLTLCDSNRLIPQISGFTTQGYVSLLTCHVQHSLRGTPYCTRTQVDRDPLLWSLWQWRKKADNFTWAFYCFSQEMTIVTSGPISLVRKLHGPS